MAEVENAQGAINNDINLKIENKKLMAQFWTLVSLDENARINSVKNILEELKNSKEEKEILYTVQRLVKGLSSGRKAARQGYATALTHVLIDFDQVKLHEVFEMMEKFHAIKGSFKGQEERDAYFGQLFGILTLNQVRTKKKIESDISKKILEKLCFLMKKKSFLREVVANSICDILNHTEFEMFESNYKPLLENILTSGWKSCTVEDFMIALKAKFLYQENLPDSYFSDHWVESSIIHHKVFQPLAKILMESTETAHPRIHSVWDMVLDHFFGMKVVKTFALFWKVVVEDGLMLSTHERKFLAINLLLKVSTKLTKEQVPIVFSEPIIRCLINSCQSKENYLYNAVKDVLKKLPGQMSKNSNEEVMLHVIKQLVGSRGHVCFDAMTKTKTVEELACKLKKDVTVYTSWLQDVFIKGTTNDENDNEVNHKDILLCRAWVISQFSSLVRSNKQNIDDETLFTIATFLFLHGFFTVLKKNKHEPHLTLVSKHSTDEATQQLCKQRFKSVLTELTNYHQQHPTLTKDILGGVTKDGEFFVTKVLLYAEKLLGLPKYVVLSEPWLPETFEAFSKSINFINTMNGEKGEKDNAIKTKSAELLFAHTTLQLFSNHEEAVDILKDLHVCYEKSREKKKRKTKEPHWTEVLTEILLGFLAQSSNLMRQVVDAIFPTIVPHLTLEAFNLLLDAIKSKPSKSSDIPDSEDKEERDKDENSEDMKEEEGEEQQEEEKEDKNDDDDKEKDGENTDSDDDIDDDEDEKVEIDENFREDIKTALGDFAVNDEDEKSENEDEDIDMDCCDPKLLESMDEALAAVFRSRKQKEAEKKEKKNMKQSVIHFKLRVLDLIEIFIKKQSKDPKILDLLEPLLEQIRLSQNHTDEQSLFERTLGIFKNKLCSLHEYPQSSLLDVSSTHERIERLIAAAKSASSALFVTYVTHAVVYLVRVLRGNSDIKVPSPIITRSQRKRKINTVETLTHTKQTSILDEGRLIKCLNDALNEFMTKRSTHLQPILFIEIIQRFPELGWMLAENLPLYLNTGCNNFRKVKACEMLRMVFSKKVLDMENCILRIKRTCLENFSKIFTESKSDGCTLKARQFHDVLHLADLFIKLVAKYPKLKDELDLKDLHQSVKVAIESPVVTRSQSLSAYCETFLKSLENFHEDDAKKIKVVDFLKNEK